MYPADRQEEGVETADGCGMERTDDILLQVKQRFVDGVYP
jgi:hypothetical protein